MAYVSTSGAPREARSWLGSFLAECVAFLQVFGAAVRVASAVESRRTPNPRDLTILGIKGGLPVVR